MTTSEHNRAPRTPPKDRSKKVACSLFFLLLIALVAGGILYLLMTRARFVPGLSPQGPIGF